MKLPASAIRSVNDLQLTLNALAPDGSACSPPSIPAAEVDIDMGESTVKVTHGKGSTKGFQLFPQVYEGTVPVALRSVEGRQASAAINAAALLSALQRAAGSPLSVELMDPDNFLADDRSGLMVGAIAGDSEALDAPLVLGATRLLDRDTQVDEVTSQDPYAVLESIDRNGRLVLMLGSWAPGNRAAPGELARKVVEAVVTTGWAGLTGDLVIADAATPAFITASRSLDDVAGAEGGEVLRQVVRARHRRAARAPRPPGAGGLPPQPPALAGRRGRRGRGRCAAGGAVRGRRPR